MQEEPHDARTIQLLVVLVVVSVGAWPCRGQTPPTVLDGFWQLGDEDPGAVPGKIGDNPTIDNTGHFPLTRVGAPIYSADAAPADGSKLSMQFSFGSGYFYPKPVTTQTDDFAISAWVKLATPSVLTLTSSAPIALFSPGIIAYDGNPLKSGFGLEALVNSTGYYFTGSLGGVTTVGDYHAVPGVWYDLELIRTNGISTLYVDGQPAGSSICAAASHGHVSDWRAAGSDAAGYRVRGGAGSVSFFSGPYRRGQALHNSNRGGASNRRRRARAWDHVSVVAGLLGLCRVAASLETVNTVRG